MAYKRLDEISQSQQNRLFYIDFRSYFLGTVTRIDLVNRFGIKEAAATRDLSQYRKISPENLIYDAVAKKYVSTESFEPVFEYASEQALRALTQGIGDDFIGIHRSLVASEIPLQLSNPDVTVLAALTSAIHQGCPAEIQYYSTTSGHTLRTIIPFSLVSNGLRWHVRAYDRKREGFRDFVVTRMAEAKIVRDQVAEHELKEADIQWNRIVELELVPHPNPNNLAHPETIALDYHMTDNVLQLQVRAAIVGYLLRRWNIDCSENHSLKGHEYQLWLSNRPTLYGVDNLSLAPGYSQGGER